MTYIVELEPGVWLASWSGDPGRTLVKESAKQYRTISLATYALARARKHRDFADAAIKEKV